MWNYRNKSQITGHQELSVTGLHRARARVFGGSSEGAVLHHDCSRGDMIVCTGPTAFSL